jgi:hypothetical protein
MCRHYVIESTDRYLSQAISTEPKEVGSYYKYVYSFDAIPDQRGRFVYNTPIDEYGMAPWYEGDNWRFSY